MSKFGKIRSRSNVFLKKINSNYMEFVGYDTSGKLIWILGEGNIITNKTRKQGSPKTHINKISPSSTMGFCCSPLRTLVIYCQKIWFRLYLKHILKKIGIVLRYIKKVKYRYVIGLPTTYGYQHFGEKNI